MMEIQLQFVLFACTVDFGLTSVPSQNPIKDQFQNLFNSIATNNKKKSEFYHELLKEEVTKEQQAFDAVKEELQIAQSQKVDRRKNFFIKRNVYESVAAVKRETNESDHKSGEKPYNFSEIKNGSAIEAVINLLNTQRTCVKEVDRLYRKICQRNKKHSEFDLLERSLDGTIELMNEVINNNTKIIEEYVKNGSASDYFKRRPMNYKSTRLLTENWKDIADFIYHYLHQFDFEVDEEPNVMRKSMDLAVSGINEYKKYLEVVYKETGVF